MAGSRKLTSSSNLSNIVKFLILCELSVCVLSLQCKSQQNEPVDWFIMYKVPGSSNLPEDSFFYMDVKSKSWSLSDKTLSDPGQAIYNTLDQIYKKSENASTGTSGEDFMYLMYNDELPRMRMAPMKKSMSRSVEKGHTKGVIGFDSESGFWFIHSTPRFPPIRTQGYSYPESATTYAQSFLCISMATGQNADKLGQQLLYNYPHIYDHSLPAFFSSKFPNMADAVNGGHVKTAPWYRETSLISLSGTKFVSFAKFAYFNNDLYSDWLAPRFGDNLLVETWQNGRNKLCSNCTGKYKVYNVENIEFQSESIMFKETQDHSKWTVTNTSRNTWTCIGDINRQRSQLGRSGGTVCFQDTSVWKNFHQIISSFHDCKPYSGCV